MLHVFTNDIFYEKHDTPEFYNTHVSAVASAILSVKWTYSKLQWNINAFVGFVGNISLQQIKIKINEKRLRFEDILASFSS